MKKLFSLLLASAMVSYCGTAPIASEVKRDSNVLPDYQGDEGEDNSTLYIVGGSVLVLAGLGCAFIGGPKSKCRKFFSETVPGMFKKGNDVITKSEGSIEEVKNATKNLEDKGAGEEALAGISKSLEEAEAALDKVKGLKKGDEGYDDAIEELEEATKKAEESAKKVEESLNQTDATKQAEEVAEGGDDAAKQG